jgi:uncharacterized DUF497 family protein
MEIVRVQILDEDKLERKHNVLQHEVFEVMHSRPRIRFSERGKSSGEDVYAAYGRTESGRYLVLFFIYKSTRVALVISARDMDDKERRAYARK